MENDELADDAELFGQYGEALLAAVSVAVRPWLHHLLSIHLDIADPALDNELGIEVEQMALAVEASIAELVAADVDTPLSGPLERIRQSVAPLNLVLEERGAQAPRRNSLDVEMRPGDRFDIGPMTFRDLGDAVHETGISWGAAKAHVHMRRRQQH